MMTQMRGKIGTWVVTAIIGFIALVFIFEGVATRGVQDGAVAGSVNGDPITLSDYNRAVERKMEFLKGMMGGKITEEQMKMFRVREGVFQELAQQKLMAQVALESGRAPSDEAVKQKIMELPYFQKEGKFDPIQYKATLQANNYSPASFEKLIREQLAVEDWNKSFEHLIRVTEAEVKAEFLTSNNQRSYKIVQIPAQAAAAKIEGKEWTPRAAAERVATLLKSDKKSDESVNAFLKPFNVSVQDAKDVAENSGMGPGLSDHPELSKALFASEGWVVGKAKIFEGPSRISVVLLTQTKRPDLSKYDADRKSLQSELKARKEREVMGEVMKKLTEKAKIESNPAIVGSKESA